MSKLSFRARALDASKPMPVYLAEDIPELLDFASVNRAVVEMPTGMEKEEETEHHLQKVLSARLHNEKQDRVVIPIPEMDRVEERYNKLYCTRGIFKPQKQYIHVQPFGIEQDIPEYDMDSEDEIWLTRQVKNLRMEVTPTTFENMMDRLEKASGQTVVSLGEAKALLKVDDELIIAIYDYWLNKRLKQQKALIPQVKMEKRDGSSGNNPYVAFRRRTEKMQTRKNRKNDETSYEKMLKLRKDLKRVLILLEMVKRREKSKKEQLKLTTEVIEKRYQMQDWDARLLDEANAKKDLLPKFVPLPPLINLTKEWGTSSKEPTTYVRKKREYKKRKHKLPTPEQRPLHPTPQIPNYPIYPDLSALPRDVISTDDDAAFSPSSPQDDIEIEPDGIYTFRRKEGCSYHAPRSRQLGSWPWCSRLDGGLADNRYQYSLASISHPYSRCVGFARQRVGRGGRVLFDRCVSQWDDQLMQLDLSLSTSGDAQSSQYINYIRTNGIQHYRPVVTQRKLCADSNMFAQYAHSDSLLKTEFTVESFQRHQEKLIAMQQQQQQQLRQQELDQDAANRTDAMSSSLASEASMLRFTLDSERAEFAVSALHDLTREPVPELGFLQHSEAAKPPTRANLSVKSLLLSSASGAGVTSGTGTSAIVSHLEQLSTSPAASILQLNYPMNGAIQLPNAPPQMSLSSSSACLSTSFSGSVSQLPFVNPQNIRRSLDCIPMSRAVNNVNKAATTKSSFLTRCPTTLVVGRSFPTTAITCGSIVPVGAHVPMTVPVGVKSSSQAIIKIGSTSGRTDLLTRENCDVLPNVAKDKAFPMEVT